MSVVKTATREEISPQVHIDPTHRLYKALDFNYVIFPVSLGVLFFLAYRATHVVGYYDFIVSENNEWNALTVFHVLLTVCFVLAQLPPYANIWGLCLPMRPFAYAQAPKTRSFRSLRVCLVTKGTNFQTVLNSAQQWEGLEHTERVHFHVVVDDENADAFTRSLPSFIKVITIPNSFRTKKAKYKARALEFYRQQECLTENDWVLHLDEESKIDASVVKSCLDFIERGDDDIGMGTIYYNDVNHWKNTFLSGAEVIRIAEDFGRFQLPVRLCRRPLLGWMHGSWILINGAVENKVTWDTACVAEDFWFAYSAAALGCKFGWLHAIIREQPAKTIHDFWRQRRRWYTGILSIDSNCFCGGVGFFVLPAYALLGGTMMVPSWFFVWLLWNLLTDAYSIMVSSIMQDLTTANVTTLSMASHAVKSVLVAPFVNLLQAVALVSSLFEPAKGFDVIAKS